MVPSINQIVQLVLKKISPATFKKAIISKVYVSAGTADVYMADNNQNILKAVPFAKTVNVAGVQPGSKCRVDVFDEKNPNDMVIAYTYGGAGSSTTIFNIGQVSLNTGNNIIAHGLGVVPNIVGFTKLATPAITKSISGGSGGGNYIANIDIWEYQAADATNIYLNCVNNTGPYSINWFAAKV